MSEAIDLYGPTFGPASGGEPKRLVILLHGYGADGNDLIALAPHFARILPDTFFISPHAPYPCEIGFGHQWFSIDNQDSDLRLEQIRVAEKILNAFIDAQLEEHGLDDGNLALVGFSQGTMMSLHTALRRDRPCAGIMGYSGRLESPDLLADEIRVRPPVTLVHGDSDELLPLNLLETAETALRANAVEVDTHVRPGLGHGIDDVGVQVGMQFLQRIFG